MVRNVQCTMSCRVEREIVWNVLCCKVGKRGEELVQCTMSCRVEREIVWNVLCYKV